VVFLSVSPDTRGNQIAGHATGTVFVCYPEDVGHRWTCGELVELAFEISPQGERI
jgi:hypothetical protein